MDKPVNDVVALNVRRIGRLDIPGGGQITVHGDRAYIGHMAPPHGTSIIDISDRSKPKVIKTIEVPSNTHSHKVRVKGDIMIVNNESFTRHQEMAGLKLPATRKRLTEELGRPATGKEVAEALRFKEEDIPALIEAAEKGFHDGGINIYDVSNPEKPVKLSFFKTGGHGVHRFDFDGRYAYISTRMDGYQGNIILIIDVQDPTKPFEVSRWWLPGQWIEGGEKPTWGDLRYECHHPLRFDDRLYVCYHAGGVIILDISDITKPKMLSHYNYHPPFLSSSHTYARMPMKLDGMDIAVVVDEQPGRPRSGMVPAFMWIFDVTDETNPQPLSSYSPSEESTPYRLGDQEYRMARFGAHQCHERMRDSLVYVTWFRGGLRVVDIADPKSPLEVGYFIPTPGEGQQTVQSNDVFVDDQGIIYLLDRFNGLEILEYTGPEAGVKPS